MGFEAGSKIQKVKYFISLLLVFWVLFPPVGHLPSYMGGYLPIPQGLAVCLFLVLLIFALTPKKGETVIQWYDFIPLALALPALIMTSLFYGEIETYEAFGLLDPKGVVFAMSLALGLLWAA